MSEDRNLADQCKKTGFKVNQVVASYHAPHGREPLYAVTVKVDL